MKEPVSISLIVLVRENTRLLPKRVAWYLIYILYYVLFFRIFAVKTLGSIVTPRTTAQR